MAKHRRKSRTHIKSDADPAKKREPRTFVFRRGRHAMVLQDLEKDLRKLMLPNTASSLKESKSNTLRDFVDISGPLGVTHFIILTASENRSYLKLAKTPRGPTVTLAINSYSLAKECLSAQARPRVPANAFKSPPLVVMNNFTNQDHLALTKVLLQNMFPSINVSKTRIGACKRAVLLNYDAATDTIQLRQYAISLAPSGLHKNVKGLLQQHKVGNLAGLQDVSEFVTKSGYGSESEGEEAEATRMILQQDAGGGNVSGRTSRVRLFELGPRLELEVIKVEEGLCEGRVLHHKLITKTAEELAALEGQLQARKQKKAERKKAQDANVARKREASEKAAKKKQQGKEGGTQEWWARNEPEGAGDEDDDEAEYREQVGAEPDEEFRTGIGKKRKAGPGGPGGRHGSKKKRSSSKP